MHRLATQEQFENWPQEAQDSLCEAWVGIHDGDLGPLVSHLRRGYNLEEALAEVIADAVENTGVTETECMYRLITVKNFRGPGGFSAQQKSYDRKFEIGRFVLNETATSPAGASEAAISLAMTKFEVKRTTVTNAVKFVRAVGG